VQADDSDLEIFQELLRQRLSPNAQNVLRNAATIWGNRRGVVTRFEKEFARVRPCSESVEVGNLMLNLCVESQFENRTTEWGLRNGGLSRIVDHFVFLDACFHDVQFTALCERWAPILLAKDQQEVRSAEEREEKFRSYFLPFCLSS
jgi:hypothetical protein